MDSVNSCHLLVNLYSTRGGISLCACLFKIPLFSSPFKRIAKVLLLNSFIEFLNLRYLTGFVVQYKGIRISMVPLFVINSLNWHISLNHLYIISLKTTFFFCFIRWLYNWQFCYFSYCIILFYIRNIIILFLQLHLLYLFILVNLNSFLSKHLL